MLSLPFASKARKDPLCRCNRCVDLDFRVRLRHEACFKGRGRKIDTFREHSVEKLAEACCVARDDVAEIAHRRFVGEEQSKHPANVVDRQRYACGACSGEQDRKSTRLNSSHVKISYAVFCLKKKTDCVISRLQNVEAFIWFVLITSLNVTLIILTLNVSKLLNLLLSLYHKSVPAANSILISY